MDLTIFIDIIASGLCEILIDACYAIDARAMRFDFRRAFTTWDSFFFLEGEDRDGIICSASDRIILQR